MLSSSAMTMAVLTELVVAVDCPLITRSAADSSANTAAATGTVPYTDISEIWFAVASSFLGTIATQITCLAGWVNSPAASIANCAT